MRLSPRMLAGTPASQRGVVLFMALVVLVVMSLIGVTMIRQGTSNQLIVGNLAFKQGATLGSDLGIEAARRWLVSQSGITLNTSNTAQGYFANGLAINFDPFTNASWNQSVETIDGQGQSVRYVIHRLCPQALPVLNADPAQQNLCIVDSSESLTKSGQDYAEIALENLHPYYRVTVRVLGPRNTTSYVQATLY